MAYDVLCLTEVILAEGCEGREHKARLVNVTHKYYS
jgi:hypothetical protein